MCSELCCYVTTSNKMKRHKEKMVLEFGKRMPKLRAPHLTTTAHTVKKKYKRRAKHKRAFIGVDYEDMRIL